ncbi:helix-turn-helix domain-containing protein [Virgibacillus sp. NKC19-3]|uniref:helix-turn-helix domain-containing protein n=1 Tax=Virgibacillus saliphilus TaxID=2831674 RepID=UPI001C9A8016|nr:AraC family transcriptional regulator [Virgibacillus sp. NKC19-3]MBY7144460.1 helix-turn-helix domain-containing protein [Virgibacillus sp. NKC19-3]
MQDLRNVVCEKRTYSGVPNTHEHPFVQLLFPLEGSMEIQTKKFSKEIDEDVIVLIPSSCMHTYYAHKRNEILVVDIPGYFIDLPDIGSGIYLEMNESWKAIRFLLLEEILTNDSHSKMIYHIVRLIAEKIRSSSILPSIEYVHNHFSESLEIEKLASIENLHPVYYTQWFKKRTGKSPVAYIQEVRLKEAKKLLTETDLSITNISLQIGYNQLSSFSRLFYKYEGQSPRIYRYRTSQKN